MQAGGACAGHGCRRAGACAGPLLGARLLAARGAEKGGGAGRAVRGMDAGGRGFVRGKGWGWRGGRGGEKGGGADGGAVACRPRGGISGGAAGPNVYDTGCPYLKTAKYLRYLTVNVSRWGDFMIKWYCRLSAHQYNILNLINTLNR